MPTITIDGKVCDFEQGQTILQIANANGIEIPQYCYHDGLSIVASCRICLAEVWRPTAQRQPARAHPQAPAHLPDPRRRGPGRLHRLAQGHPEPEGGHGVPADQPPARLPGL
ncbi:MAG: 2Fe-2S iron-sulfur cluster-binding protein [Phycisphaerales bacterium]